MHVGSGSLLASRRSTWSSEVVMPVGAGSLCLDRDRHGPQRRPLGFHNCNGGVCDGVATSILLIASHDRPFMGQVSVGPDPLLQVMPLGEDRLSGRGVAERLSTKEKTSLGDDHVARAESTQDGVWSHPSGVPAGPAAG